jgi:hypothetical protein
MASWFEAQPEEVQKQGGFMIYTGIAALIGDDKYHATENPDQAFLAWLKDSPSGKLEALAKTLLAREHIRFTMIDGCCTAENWVKAVENNQAILKYVEEKGEPEHMKDLPRQMIEDAPRRSAVFMKSGDDWHTNVAAFVSDEAIRAWYDAALFDSVATPRIQRLEL